VSEVLLTAEQQKTNGDSFRELAGRFNNVELAFVFTLLCEDPETLRGLLDAETVTWLAQRVAPHLVGAFEQMGVHVDMNKVPPNLRPT